MTFIQKHAYGIGAAFASALWPFFRKRRRVAVVNILKCFHYVGITDSAVVLLVNEFVNVNLISAHFILLVFFYCL